MPPWITAGGNITPGRRVWLAEVIATKLEILPSHRKWCLMPSYANQNWCKIERFFVLFAVWRLCWNN